MNQVRAKKALGQHFLTDLNIARKICFSLSGGEAGEPVKVLEKLLFNYAQLDTHPDRNQLKDFRARVRAMLQEQKPYFGLLSVRNKALAMMICKAPWTFRIAYGTYVALFQREEQH